MTDPLEHAMNAIPILNQGPIPTTDELRPQSIIPISASTVGDESVQTVNARDLHTFLENGDLFANWIKDRIRQFGFIENQDFVTVLESTKTVKNGKTYQSPRTEYHVTLSMAKELAMVERNEKGKQARLYFIECERQAKERLVAIPDLDDPTLLQHLLLHHVEKRLEAERRAAEAEQKADAASTTVDAYNRIAKSDGSLCITDAAKVLNVRPKDLFAWLRQHGWIYSRPGRPGTIAYQDRIQVGLMEHKVVTISRTDGTEKTVDQVRVTIKGLTKLAMLVSGGQQTGALAS